MLVHLQEVHILYRRLEKFNKFYRSAEIGRRERGLSLYEWRIKY